MQAGGPVSGRFILLSSGKSAFQVWRVNDLLKLAHLMGLEHPMACGKRLENLQSLGAIAGLKME